MKKELAVLAMLALVGSFATADDKGTEFKFGGEVMQRFENTQDANLQSGNGGSVGTDWLMRNQFHVNAISGDKLQAYFDFIHASLWGGAEGVPTGTYPLTTGGAGSQTNQSFASTQSTLQVNEAWLWWKLSDMASLRSGRQSMNYGDGLAFSRNEWLAVPYSVDGIMARLSWDFLDLDVGGGVLADVGPGGAVLGGAGLNDNETVFYGFYGSLKNLPDVMKTADLFVLQVNQDGGFANTTNTQLNGQFPSYINGGGSLGLTNIGVHLKGDFSMIDWRLDGVYQTGAQKAQGAVPSMNYSSDMIDAEVGANFAEFMKARVFVNFHTDTGDSDSTRQNQHQYQPLFYDRHAYSGMDAIGWGNLTDFRVGASLNPADDTSVGVWYMNMTRTSTTSLGNGAYSPTQWLQPNEGNLLTSAYAPALSAAGWSAPTGTNGSSSNLGSLIGVWGKHDYGHGLSALANVAFFSPGSYFGNSLGSPWQFAIQGKYAF